MWENEGVPMLEAEPGIRAVAIFEEICRRHPAIARGCAGPWSLASPNSGCSRAPTAM